MGFRNNAIATVWKIKEPTSDKYRDIQITIGRKNKQTGTYDNDFSGYVRFIGDALKRIDGIKVKDRIKLKSVDSARKYDPERKIEFTTYIVFDWDYADKKEANSFIGGCSSTRSEYLFTDLPNDEFNEGDL